MELQLHPTWCGEKLYNRDTVINPSNFVDSLQNASLKGNILDDIHLPAYFLLCTVVLDETDTGTREEMVGTQKSNGVRSISFK